MSYLQMVAVLKAAAVVEYAVHLHGMVLAWALVAVANASFEEYCNLFRLEVVVGEEAAEPLNQNDL